MPYAGLWLHGPIGGFRVLLLLVVVSELKIGGCNAHHPQHEATGCDRITSCCLPDILDRGLMDWYGPVRSRGCEGYCVFVQVVVVEKAGLGTQAVSSLRVY